MKKVNTLAKRIESRDFLGTTQAFVFEVALVIDGEIQHQGNTTVEANNVLTAVRLLKHQLMTTYINQVEIDQIRYRVATDWHTM